MLSANASTRLSSDWEATSWAETTTSAPEHCVAGRASERAGGAGCASVSHLEDKCVQLSQRGGRGGLVSRRPLRRRSGEVAAVGLEHGWAGAGSGVRRRRRLSRRQAGASLPAHRTVHPRPCQSRQRAPSCGAAPSGLSSRAPGARVEGHTLKPPLTVSARPARALRFALAAAFSSSSSSEDTGSSSPSPSLSKMHQAALHELSRTNAPLHAQQ